MGPFDAPDQADLNHPKGIDQLGTEDEAIGGANFPHQNSGIPHAKRLTLAASPSFGGRCAGLQWQSLRMDGACVKLGVWHPK